MKSKHIVQNFNHPLILFALLTSLSIVSCSIFSVSRPEQQGYPEVMGEFPLKKIWSFDASNKFITTPVMGEGKVFFRTEDSIYAIDELRGELIWSSPLPAGIDASPADISNGIVVSPYKGGIKAINSVDGKVVWDQDLVTYGSESQIMAITANQVFVNLVSDSVNVFNLHNGNLEWLVPTGRGSTDVFPDNDDVYFLEGKKLTAFDITSGSQLWEKEIRPAGVNLYQDGILFYSPVIDLHRNFLAAFDIRRQVELWNISTPEDVTSISYFDNKLFVSLKSSLACINPIDGSAIWRTGSVGDEFLRSIKLDLSIYVKSSFSREIYAFSEKDGEVQGSLKIGKPAILYLEGAENQDIIATNNVLVFSTGTQIFAYGK